MEEKARSDPLVPVPGPRPGGRLHRCGPSPAPDAALFQIDEAGTLSLNEPLDFEAPASAAGTNDYSLNVVATDDNRRPLSLELPVTVAVTNVNEGPVSIQEIPSVELTAGDGRRTYPGPERVLHRHGWRFPDSTSSILTKSPTLQLRPRWRKVSCPLPQTGRRNRIFRINCCRPLRLEHNFHRQCFCGQPAAAATNPS